MFLTARYALYSTSGRVTVDLRASGNLIAQSAGQSRRHNRMISRRRTRTERDDRTLAEPPPAARHQAHHAHAGRVLPRSPICALGSLAPCTPTESSVRARDCQAILRERTLSRGVCDRRVLALEATCALPIVI